MQSRLTDVNSACVKYRATGITAITRHQFTTAIGCLLSMNGLLDEEFRLKIDDDLYSEITTNVVTFTCKHCDKTTGRETIRLFKYNLNTIQQLVYNEKSIDSWRCSVCKKVNFIIDTQVNLTELESPSYTKVVPKPPSRKNGLMGRTKFHNDMIMWFWTTLANLEERLAAFRDANWNKEELFDEEGIDTTDEEGEKTRN